MNRLEWDAYVLPGYSPVEFGPGQNVVDVGCGPGFELRQLTARHCRAIGLDVDFDALRTCRAAGLNVLSAQAEHLPLRTAKFDGALSSVVIPYTDEARALAEIARILKPGARAFVSYHGFGYFLRYVCAGSLGMRLYGVRSLLNTWWYRLSGDRLPGFWGDTLYQSNRRLGRYYHRQGWRLVRSRLGPKFLGLPVFIYHDLERS